jgi:hypothetical protein
LFEKYQGEEGCCLSVGDRRESKQPRFAFLEKMGESLVVRPF